MVDNFVEPSIGPKLEQLYGEQDADGLKEAYDARHLADYQLFASLGPIPEHVLVKGRHRQLAGHDNCTSCHFCRQCTEDLKPRCSSCGKHFCGPCLANRFGQNAEDMRSYASWRCPVCIDICNCSGTNCRRAQLGLGATASLIHEAQSYGYSSVCTKCSALQAQKVLSASYQCAHACCKHGMPSWACTTDASVMQHWHATQHEALFLVQVAEYLLITSLFREGTQAEAQAALEWLANPRRQFAAEPVKRSRAGVGVRIRPPEERCVRA